MATGVGRAGIARVGARTSPEKESLDNKARMDSLPAVAADLKDLRAKITVLAWIYLEAESRSTGREMSELVREILQRWASERHSVATVARSLLHSEGIVGKEGER